MHLSLMDVARKGWLRNHYVTFLFIHKGWSPTNSLLNGSYTRYFNPNIFLHLYFCPF